MTGKFVVICDKCLKDCGSTYVSFDLKPWWDQTYYLCRGCAEKLKQFISGHKVSS